MKKPVKILLIILCVFIISIATIIGFFFLLIEPDFIFLRSETLDLDKLASYSQTVTLLDSNGNRINDVMSGNNSIVVDIDDLHDYTVNAFIAIEDKRFNYHHGVDFRRMGSALLSDFKTMSFREGASTITQQLIKNTHLSNKKTIGRKISEIRLARKLERVYDKTQILESYLNILYFGSGIRGLGTASRVMFNIPASRLTLAQSAYLASIINNPTKYSPYDNIENLTNRQHLVLYQMLSQGLISDAEYISALNEKVIFGKNKQNQYIGNALKEACATLKCSEKVLFSRNYNIVTSYDAKLTAAVRKIIQADESKYTIRVLILDNKSGGILCDEINKDGNINPQRSPASAIKPFLSYATALENGMTPLSQIIDEPAVFGDYAPKNYKGIYNGYQSLTDSLKNSSNIVAVKLLRECGIEKAKTVASAFGIHFEDGDDSLSIALGGMQKGVTLPQLANAYRTLANGGVYSDIGYLRSITTDNDIIYNASNNNRVAISSDTAYLLTDMLLQCARTGTAKKLKYSGIIAAKTGTNGDENGNTDCYCVAYTPVNTIAVWFGADKETIPNNITGAKCCDIINELYNVNAIKTDVAFDIPQSVAYYEIDGLALDECHEVYLADPLLPMRYRRRVLLSKRNLPIRKIDLIDYYDKQAWDNCE